MTDILLSVPSDDPKLPSWVEVPAAQVTGIPDSPDDIGAATAEQGALADATKVEQVTLTAPLVYALPTGLPSGVVHRVTFAQDGAGGHTVTYDGKPVAVDLTAGAVTTVELHPAGAGYVVRYPVVDLDAQVSALAEDGGSALGASLSSTYVAAGDGLPHKIVAGVLRRDAVLGWQWIDDSNHAPVNGATVTADASKITITFPAQAKVNAFNVTIDDYYASLGYSVGASVGTSNALIYCYSPPKIIGGYIKYASSVWNVSATSGVNSAAFNTGTGVLTISHDYMTGYACSVVSRDGIYIPVITGGGGSSTTVAFYDWAGTRIMAPDTSMKFYFTYSRPAAVLDPTAMGTTGNLWCLGVFQSS